MTLYNVHDTVHDAVHGVVQCAWLCIWLCARRWVGDVHGAVQCIHVTMHGAVLGIVRDIVQYMALYSIDVGHGLCSCMMSWLLGHVISCHS